MLGRLQPTAHRPPLIVFRVAKSSLLAAESVSSCVLCGWFACTGLKLQNKKSTALNRFANKSYSLPLTAGAHLPNRLLSFPVLNETESRLWKMSHWTRPLWLSQTNASLWSTMKSPDSQKQTHRHLQHTRTAGWLAAHVSLAVHGLWLLSLVVTKTLVQVSAFTDQKGKNNNWLVNRKKPTYNCLSY